MEIAINWDRIDRVRRAHDWSWAEIARRVGWSAPHFSELRHGLRKPNLSFVACLCVALDLNWNDVLKPLPKMDGMVSARQFLNILTMEDGRPWPVHYSREADRELERRKQYAMWRHKQRSEA